jgi:hypothetical protein
MASPNPGKGNTPTTIDDDDLDRLVEAILTDPAIVAVGQLFVDDCIAGGCM